jgi:hypothetical protein
LKKIIGFAQVVLAAVFYIIGLLFALVPRLLGTRKWDDQSNSLVYRTRDSASRTGAGASLRSSKTKAR